MLAAAEHQLLSVLNILMGTHSWLRHLTHSDRWRQCQDSARSVKCLNLALQGQRPISFIMREFLWGYIIIAGCPPVCAYNNDNLWWELEKHNKGQITHVPAWYHTMPCNWAHFVLTRGDWWCTAM